MKNRRCCTQKYKKTQELNKSFFRDGIMSALGLKSFGLKDILPYIHPLVLIQIQYKAELYLRDPPFHTFTAMCLQVHK